MKIQDPNQRLHIEAYVNNTQATQDSKQQQVQQQMQSQARECDRVELSSGSRLLHRVNEAMKVQDPERAARVEALKAQVQKGTYKADPSKVADSMIRDIIKDLG